MLRSLQACRASAALLVVLLHTSEGIFALPKYFANRPLGSLFAFGGAGVDFFFVLSGFIIAHVHWDDVGRRERLRPYFGKRLTRIFPAYWAVLVPVQAVFWLVPSFGKGHERDPLTMVCSALLLPLPSGDPVLIVSWSLVYEVFFYALFGLLIASRAWGSIVVAAWLAIVVAGLAGLVPTYPWTFLGNAYHLHFIAGVLLALALKRCRVPLPRCVAACGVAIFLTTGLIESYFLIERTLAHLLGYLLGTVLVLAGIIEAERSQGLRPPWLLVFLGDASYSIYLVHFPALSILAKAAKALDLHAWIPAPFLFVLLAAGATATGCLFHVAVERPCLRYFRRRPVPATVTVPPTIAMPAPRRRAA